MVRGKLPTLFAPAERLSADEIALQNQQLRSHPLVAEILDCLPDPTAILNEHRQIVLANRALAELLHTSPEQVMGLRPGEAMSCIRSNAHPGGCGTSSFCRYCGAVEAILESQNKAVSCNRECRITRESPHEPSPLDLRVWATPLPSAGPFTLFAIKDISDEKRRAVLERIFYHDVLNAAGGLLAAVELWNDLEGPEAVKMSAMARSLAEQIIEELRAGRDLAAAENGRLVPEFREIDVAAFLGSLCTSYSCYASAADTRLVAGPVPERTKILSDEALLRRILGNLIKNALESSNPGQVVTVRFESRGGPSFSVHNDTVMSESVRSQIFQRSFTTQTGAGHGVGAFSVKILTELLSGTVSFTSTIESGTTFTVRLPASPAHQM